MILQQFTLCTIIAYVGGMHCKSNPCMYGVCKDVENSSYTCYCIDGYTGVNCEINSNDCWSDPCLNGGTCNDGIANYNCTCLEGFTGERCEIDAIVCDDSLCTNGGKCKEGLGMQFSCECAEGWIGPYCEIDINECLHSPCQNGGLCINLQPSYICACLFGFTGKNCDEALLPCEINSCQNDALCLLEDNQNVCYCVPDYHGAACELKYNNCEQHSIVCQNGGTCIDDFFNFTCNCLPHFTGRFCSSVLDNVITTPPPLPKTTSGILFEITQTSSPITILSASARTSTTTSSSEPDLVNVTIGSSTSYFDLFLSTSTEKTSTDVITSTSMATTIATSGSVEEPSSSTETEEGSSSTETTTVGRESTNFTSSSFSLVTFESTTSYVEGLPSLTPLVTEEVGTMSSMGLTYTPSVYPIWSTSSSSVTSKETVTESTVTSKETVTTEEEQTVAAEGFSYVPVRESTTETVVTTGNESYVTETDGEYVDTRETTMKMTRMDGTTTQSVVHLTEMEETVTPGMVSSTGGTEGVMEIATTTTSGGFTPVTAREIDYCDQSTCVTKSYCPKFGLCNCLDNARNIGFNGTSYIRHDVMVSTSNTLLINVTLVTKSKNGILMHTLFDNERYALLHLRLGQLQLQLSCGSQKILFGTIDAPINNGYAVFMALSFQYILEEPLYKCIAKLYVNGTVIMSGEQAILSYDILPRAVRLYLGGIPLAVPYYISHASLGFVGCLNSLHVNNEYRYLVRDATEIYQVSNCETFNCFLNPCENSGYCEDVNGDIKCNCLPGYVGKFCEKSVCDNSPCYLGATCVTFPGSTFICICPLGKHGLLCEKDVDITVPSFSTILPGLSSYMAFGFKNSLKNYLELNLRIKPLINEQISLIAYLGQSNAKKNAFDYFAVTYVQGYLMLTWDLGSGVRRIFTDIPLNVGVRKFYTLNVGRKGKMSWMYVEGIGNVTGFSYGSMTSLDVSPILYIGGHKSKNFEKLPHDLPLHTGFVGCITDIQMRTEDNFYKVQEADHVVGRNVGQCDSNECSANSCNNGAVCLNHGPSYRCICMRGWEGSDCTVQSYIPPNVCSR